MGLQSRAPQADGLEVRKNRSLLIDAVTAIDVAAQPGRIDGVDPLCE